MPKVNVMAQQKDEEQLADVFFFTIAIESLVAYGTGGEGGEGGEVISQSQTAEGAGAAPERQAPATRTAQCGVPVMFLDRTVRVRTQRFGSPLKTEAGISGSKRSLPRQPGASQAPGGLAPA